MMAASDEWWLYIIETAQGHLYTGITTDVARRLREHSAGDGRGAKALRGKGPLRLRYQCNLQDKRTALRLEYRIKQLPRQRKLMLIDAQSTPATLRLELDTLLAGGHPLPD